MNEQCTTVLSSIEFTSFPPLPGKKIDFLFKKIEHAFLVF